MLPLSFQGATIVDQIVNITPAEDYIYIPVTEQQLMVHEVTSRSSASTAELEYSSEVTHHWANASARINSFDKRVGLSEKINNGIYVVNERVKSVDQRLHVSDKTMAALQAAERKLNDTGSAVKTNRYVSAGTSWLNGAFSKVAKAGHVAGSRTREKFQLAVSNLTAKLNNIFAHIYSRTGPDSRSVKKALPGPCCCCLRGMLVKKALFLRKIHWKLSFMEGDNPFAAWRSLRRQGNNSADVVAQQADTCDGAVYSSNLSNKTESLTARPEQASPASPYALVAPTLTEAAHSWCRSRPSPSLPSASPSPSASSSSAWHGQRAILHSYLPHNVSSERA
ncbi:RNA binding (RRM/RBD/RNP motifs) family protein [Zea mays]|uniref:RNA binding (RRM/RBD/RNP motifs) family protein n=1 Tax=Zea mays TaxID=4577 RepID=A0A1D6KZ32_MAIZE|nr:RNA binding (RRM/RBD/RNP motifs) family protein [Zea mays]